MQSPNLYSIALGGYREERDLKIFYFEGVSDQKINVLALLLLSLLTV